MTTSVVYLLHFERPFEHARHYLGSAVDLELRLAEQDRGGGSRLMWWVHQAGISRTLARTWRGGGRRRPLRLEVVTDEPTSARSPTRAGAGACVAGGNL